MTGSFAWWVIVVVAVGDCKLCVAAVSCRLSGAAVRWCCCLLATARGSGSKVCETPPECRPEEVELWLCTAVLWQLPKLHCSGRPRHFSWRWAIQPVSDYLVTTDAKGAYPSASSAISAACCWVGGWCWLWWLCGLLQPLWVRAMMDACMPRSATRAVPLLDDPAS